MYLWEKASEREYLSYGFMLCAMIAACFVKCKLGHIFVQSYAIYLGVTIIMSMIDRLLEDKEKKAAEKPVQDYEIKRWSKMYGEPCIVELHALDTQLFEEIADNAVSYTKSGKVKGVNNFNAGARIVINGVFDKETGKPFFKDAKLLKHFGAATPFDLVDLLLLPGEMGEIASAINKLSGVKGDDEADTDEIVKN